MKLNGTLYVDSSSGSLKATELCRGLATRGMMNLDVVHVVNWDVKQRAELERRLGTGLFLPLLVLPLLGNYAGWTTISAYFTGWGQRVPFEWRGSLQSLADEGIQIRLMCDKERQNDV